MTFLFVLLLSGPIRAKVGGDWSEGFWQSALYLYSQSLSGFVT